jgi:hypothetical protein
MWLEVPINCATRDDKDELIIGIINHLEHTIKIN